MVYNVGMYTKERGAALLDSVIAIAIFVVLFVGFFALMQVGIKTVTEHRARAGALALARSHIEYIRSLDYSTVGTQGGNPSGSLPVVSSNTLNNLSYTLSTSITWQDDPGDGLSGSGDAAPNDYKAVRVEVSWQEHGGSTESIVLSSFIADFVTE